MAEQIAAWFREIIKDKVHISYQNHGGWLDNTMMRGDTQAGTVKFPIIGQSTVYKLTGAIERVPVGNPALTTVQITFDDYEAAEWWRVQDAYKAGPVEQSALAQIITLAIRRKKDEIKWAALELFAENNANVETIGDGSAAVDIIDMETARSQVAGIGLSPDVNVYAGIPAMWMSQLAFYEEFANARWVGPDNAPFSKPQRSKMRTVRGVTYIELPDEMFSEPDTDEQYAYMWAEEAMGAETPWNQENPSMSKHEELQGSPILVKAGLGGAAIGIEPLGVKRLHFAKLAAPARPS